MKFYKYGDNRRTKQKFNQDVSFVKYGKKIRIKDYIQENANEVNIYKNLEKYGSIENATKAMSRIRPQVIADFEEAEDLRSLEEKRIKLENTFYSMPVEERAKFGNSLANFIDNGYQYYTLQIQEEIKKAQAEQDKQGGKENGTEK